MKMFPRELRFLVVSDPFTWIQGEFVRIRGRERVVMNAQFLSSSVSVELDSTEVCVL